MASKVHAEMIADLIVENKALKKRNHELLLQNKGLTLALSPEVVETLAAHCHDEQWSGWVEYMLNNLQPDMIARWQRQVDTPYEELSENEKESDRIEARQIIDLLWKFAEERMNVES